MSLADSLQKDMIAAMKAKDKEKLSTVRMLKAAVANEKINAGHDLSPEEEIAVLSRELKQRKDSLEEFKNAGREDSVKQLEKEIEVVQSYLPKQLSEDEVKDIVLCFKTKFMGMQLSAFLVSHLICAVWGSAPKWIQG